MRSYSKISPKFWVGRTGKDIRGLGLQAQIVAMYLLTSPHANMLGLYHLPLLYIAADTGIDTHHVAETLTSLSSTGFCSYDHASEMVWVCEMARFQCLDSGSDALQIKDNRVKAICKEYADLPDSPLLFAFYDKYRSILHLETPRGAPCEGSRCGEGSLPDTPPEAPCKAPSEGDEKPLAEGSASQEQEKEQEQEQEKEQEYPTQGSTGKGKAGSAPDGVPGEPGEEQRDPVWLDDDPSLEFLELRNYYNEHIRQEAMRTGLDAYRALRVARRWPGMHAIYSAIDAYADAYGKAGCLHLVPGFARFLREDWWVEVVPPSETRTSPVKSFAEREAETVWDEFEKLQLQRQQAENGGQGNEPDMGDAANG